MAPSDGQAPESDGQLSDEQLQKAVREGAERRRQAEEETAPLIEHVHQVADEVRCASAQNPSSWQANPAGLSGRLIRGYRNWRYKR
jgi:hypothetical protein